MSILLNNDGDNLAWYQALSEQLPDMKIECFPDISDISAIEYALVWQQPLGDLKRYHNLKAILSLGAGVDHLLVDKHLPDVPIVRLADDAMADDMAKHSLYWLLHFQRHYQCYRDQQNKKIWQRLGCLPARDFRVGLLGLGNIGGYIANYLMSNGYPVNGWSRSVKKIAGVACFAGQAQLGDFLANLSVVINCLPATGATKQMINHAFFQQMPKGAFFINIGRGDTVSDVDLLQALDTGQIQAAALDVLKTEPPEADCPYWQHPRVFLTPHMSGPTHVQSGAKLVADNIKRIVSGQKPSPLYDGNSGY